MDLMDHEAAGLFPLMEGQAFAELVADIRANGLRDPIILADGKILDGRNRYRACKKADIPPRFEAWGGGDVLAYVVSKNLHRRHLNESQRALVAARLANCTREQSLIQNRQQDHSDGSETQIPASVTIKQAAHLLNVGKGTVDDARCVLTNGTPAEIAGVERGELSVCTLRKQIKNGQSHRSRAANRTKPQTHVGKNPERIQNMRMRADIWARLSAALDALGNLPAAADVAKIVRENDSRSRVVAQKLPRATRYLKDFSDAWHDQ